MSDREPQSGELVPCKLRCFLCRAVHEIALPAEGRIRDELTSTKCPTCGRNGMQLARLIPPPPSEKTRLASKYEEPPDMEGDEYLAERRARCRE